MLREFTDAGGTRWRVWDVNPLPEQGRTFTGAAVFANVPQGWLCFDSGRERRRLTPVPGEWHQFDDDQLVDLCQAAETVPRIARDLDVEGGPGR